MRNSRIITYIIGILAFLIPLKLYFTPPTDYDGGPMMAYNFLFFYPLAFLSILLSIIVFFRLKYFKNDLKSKISLIILILPSSILTLLVAINFIQIANEPEIIDLETLNNTVNLNVNDSLEIKLYGLTKRTLDNNEEIITVKIINLIPYINGKYSFKDGGKFTSKSANQEIYYKIENDTLIIYNQDFDFNFFNTTRISLPFKIENFESKRIKTEQLEEINFKNFDWK